MTALAAAIDVPGSFQVRNQLAHLARHVSIKPVSSACEAVNRSAGRRYTVLAKAELTDHEWTASYEELAGTGEMLTAIFPAVPASPRIFQVLVSAE